MEYIFRYLTSTSNYKLTNQINVFNFIYDVIQLNPDKSDEIMAMIKKNIGMEFFRSFESYAFRKGLEL